jgi:hypothetical protein
MKAQVPGATGVQAVMDRTLPTALAAATALLIAAPGVAQAATERPALLPAVKRALTANATSCQTTTYRAPMSGFVSARLTGKGDWDLFLLDASKRRVASSQSFGGAEVTQAWVAAGQRLVARACRRDGAASRRATVSFVLADVTPPKAPAGKPMLVRVQAAQEKLHGLEEMGFDVTHNMRAGWADVMLTGTKQLEQLKKTGLKYTVRTNDMTRAFRAARQADRAFTARVGEGGSALPSGRTEYRTYEDFQADLKQLVADHPDMARPVVFGKSHQGRELSGVEITSDVNAADGKPVYFLMGNHHAREWPSGEAAMEFATMLVKDRSNPRIRSLLSKLRVVVLPLVNPDGYVVSRNAFSVADTLGQNPNLTLVEIVAPPGGVGAYRRKNCNAEIAPASFPCELAWGVDNNRNYGNLWGGPGSSSDVTSQSYHGPGPRSEPETQAVWNYARTHHVTTLMSLHTIAALVLRPPGLHDAGLAPDEERMKQVGDAMGKAAGYTSQYSWQLYDTAGTTEDDTYAATGGFGYTVEMGPPDGEFHMPYETGVVNEWTGNNDHAKGAGGLREALLIAAESAANPADHAVLKGSAPAGKVLRLKKAFDTKTSAYCEKSVELILNVGFQPPCLTGEKPALTLEDTQDTTTVVPASGRFEWHVGPSTRPFVGGGATVEETKDVEPPLAQIKGAPGAPASTVDHEITVPQLGAGDKLKITLTPTLPEDYDIEVHKDGKVVGSSGNIPGSAEEVLLADPAPGTYVVRVAYYAAVTGTYEITAKRVTTTRTTTTGTKEAYTLTCEEPDGTVLDQRRLVIDRGQVVTADLCGGGAGAGAGTTAGSRSGAADAKKVARRKVALTGSKARKGGVALVKVGCPRSAPANCTGVVRLSGVLKGKKATRLASKRFTTSPGRTASVHVKVSRPAQKVLRRKRRLPVRVDVTGTAGDTVLLANSRKLTLRR